MFNEADENILLSSPEFVKQKEYWSNKLAGDFEETGILFAAKKNYKPETEAVEIEEKRETVGIIIPSRLYKRLMKLSKQSELSLYIILLTTLKSLLYRYTGREDITVISPVYKFNISQFTINDYIFIRDDIDGEKTFIQLLLQVRQTVLEAHENQDYPFDRLKEFLFDESRGQAKHPVSNIECSLKNIHVHREKGTQGETIGFSFTFSKEENKIAGSICYDANRYDESDMEGLSKMFLRILESVMEDVHTKVCELSFLTPEEKRRLLFEFNNNRADYPYDQTIHRFIEKHGEVTSHKVALVCEDHTITYMHLNRRANQLARMLKDKGLQPDQPVGILLERSPVMVESILAVWKSGGAYIPLDWQYPVQRIAGILTDSKTTLLIAASRYVAPGLKAAFYGEIIELDQQVEVIENNKIANLDIDIDMNSLSYIFYTSGSTGKPKGAMVEHIGMMNHIQAKINDLQINADTVVSQNSSHTFDISVWQFFVALTMGGKTVIYPNALVLEIDRILRRFISDRVTILEVVPSYLSVMMDFFEMENFFHIERLAFRYLLVTGETVKPTLVHRWFERFPSIPMVNAYGPTEASDDITHYIMHKAPDMERIPIGSPLQNLNIYIVDENMKLLPVGVKGEICVSGVGVGRGYLNDEEKTRHVFMEDLFVEKGCDEPGGLRLYRTGDLGCWLPDGTIDFFGRKDYQLKIRGFRIELGEIESQMCRHPNVKEAVVINKEDEGGNKYLCAYLVKKTGVELNVSVIRTYLVKRLPDHMVPLYFIQLEQMPLTPNGKINRSALPDPSRAESESNTAGMIPFISEDMLRKFSVPTDNEDEKVMNKPSVVMATEKGDDTGTFSCFIIGESTLPIKCAEVILRKGQRLFGMISNDVQIKEWAKRNKIPYIPARKRDILAALEQEAFDYLFSVWNLFILSEDILALPLKGAYNMHDAPLPRYAGVYAPTWALLRGEKTHGITWHVLEKGIDTGDIIKQVSIDIDKEETTLSLHLKCFKAGVGAFEALIDDLAAGQVTGQKQDLDERNYFKPAMRPTPACLISFNWDADKIAGFMRALDFGDYDNPFGTTKIGIGREFFILPEISVLDSSTPQPPGTIININEESLIVSTASTDIEIRKILTIDGKAMVIPDFVRKYGLSKGSYFNEIESDTDTAARIDEYSPIIYKHEGYWLKKLRDLQPFRFPDVFLSTPGTKGEEAEGPAKQRFPIPGEIETIDYITTRNDFILTAFAAYLLRLTGIYAFDMGCTDLFLQQEINGLEGLFAKHVPLHVEADSEQTFNQFYKNLQKELKRIRKRKTYMRDILMRYALSASTPGNNLPIGVILVDSLENHDLFYTGQLAFVIPSDGNECICLYNPLSLDEKNIDKLLCYFSVFIKEVCSNPLLSIPGYSLVDDKDRHRLLYELNDTDAEYSTDKTLMQLLEEQVKKTADKTALVFKDRRITYMELNEKVNRLARQLRDRGVEANSIVGLMTGRSIEMIIGLFAILKAGGAYIPIDPMYPGERIRYMLEDSNSKILLINNKDKLEKFTANTSPLVFIDLEDMGNYRGDSSDLPVINSPMDLVHVLYTSGTTGTPKGVMIENRSVINLIKGITDIIDYRPDDGVLSLTTLSFDIFGAETLLPLTRGIKVVIASVEDQVAPAAAGLLIEREQIAGFHITPSGLQSLISDPVSSRSLRGIRYILVAGEIFPEVLIEKARRVIGGKVYNLYAPAETTIYSTVKDVSTGESMNIGKPIANTRIYTLSQSGKLQPEGVAGEICIGGDGVARGYVNRPELTAEKFLLAHSSILIADRREKKGSSSSEFPMRYELSAMSYLYRTGDLARWLPDGNIEFLGRMDHQVQLRGIRVEPAEIEKCLLRHDNVKEAVIVDRERDSGDKYLCAYVVADQPLLEFKVRDYLAEELPFYMVPSRFLQLEKVPLTPNGKVDRALLQGLDITGLESSESGYEAPTNPIEERLVEIWSDVLKVDPGIIGVQHNFFRLGGHSLNVTVMSAKIHNAFDVKVPLVEIFRAPTVRELARYISEEEERSVKVTTVDERLVLLKSTRAEGAANIFFIHEITGQSEAYIELLKQLNISVNCYGIRVDTSRQNNYVPGITTLGNLAAQYIDAIKKIQPDGPYYIAGYSIGGTIAFEMAWQIEQQKEEVKFLGLMDAPGPLKEIKEKELQHTLQDEMQGVEQWLSQLEIEENLTSTLKEELSHVSDLSQVWPLIVDYFAENNVPAEPLKKMVPAYIAQLIPNYQQMGVKELLNYQTIIRSISTAVTYYTPTSKINTQVHFFVPTERENHEEIQNWTHYCTMPILDHEVTGNHVSMMQEPNVVFFARQLENILSYI
jgi:amino acid adenylation domain-containing protein